VRRDTHGRHGRVPAIHAFFAEAQEKTWMPATSAGMTLKHSQPRGVSLPVPLQEMGENIFPKVVPGLRIAVTIAAHFRNRPGFRRIV
jgi:hypothetical protein